MPPKNLLGFYVEEWVNKLDIPTEKLVIKQSHYTIGMTKILESGFRLSQSVYNIIGLSLCPRMLYISCANIVLMRDIILIKCPHEL